ncbi:bifunctional 5,10-methylenetetrahydrofolate dehydrogenase/5,10-methenyltetrahydrofolate cyclohydrolase [Alicyclobacillus tolerans]|uniref:bifunctional 5,10-methylenetetrahydrofolate dehydrogenase/5,10-methenyltetrahydrofolate cyclohydrolase n=1 Tax=Alicyclobacillus tolerans TaxID=90970 RepID=UPI001F2279D6|nr:bifunctional 5,10-methylenetetrahydrofolate dehydrogenase/5,10-methenyltetrahydrofolate cyclohydrolase [Alicyclobacillus tolerans]MCF8564932.1 bifunctional 5,10-methylenetetrahydrofolate dehydrogenase/5,10-methenyltetrahydrofolate cyclohydrolase [Alicyclobacillus tolerans]
MAIELKGKPVADKIRESVSRDVANWKAQGTQPKMAVILVEGDPASAFYARAKQQVAHKLGIEYELLTLPHNVSESELLAAVHGFNEDPLIHGIMLELPLPRHISPERVIASIDPAKDVDGLTQFNRMANMTGEQGIYPATPMACVRLVKHYGYTLAGKHVVLVGCGKTVGQPLMHLLLRELATVTVCHAGTRDLSAHLEQAELAFVAVGKAGLIEPHMVHKDLVIVDAGINETKDHQIVGDVAPEVAEAVQGLSPTPGGVGSVTTMQLFANLMKAMKLQQEAQTEDLLVSV